MQAPRFHVETSLRPGIELVLPANAARHVQVLRLQPGAALTLFDGQGGEWAAQVVDMGRREVSAQVLEQRNTECELRCAITLALGMPVNERMDGLVEKATELGAAAITPLVCERSVLRVAGERAERKAAHWQAIAASACEQSGRNRLPMIRSALPLRDWMATLSWWDAEVRITPRFIPRGSPRMAAGVERPPELTAAVGANVDVRLMLSLDQHAIALMRYPGLAAARSVTLLSGPEGGLGPAEQALAIEHGFTPISLGARVLRADTAPLAALACMAALEGSQ